MDTINIKTPANGFVSITSKVAEIVAKSGVFEGICTVYCPHTTAGICINENADPDVQRDLTFAFSAFFPDRVEYQHFEGNSAAHLKSVLCGASETIPITGGRLALGRWQGIYFAEFDGPRSRNIYVQIVKS